MTTPQTPAPQAVPAPPKKSHAKLIIIILVVVFVLFTGSAAGCYFLFFKNKGSQDVAEQPAATKEEANLEEQAAKALKEHKFTEAADLYGQLIAKNDKNGHYYIGRAEAEASAYQNVQDNLQKASDDTEAGLKLNSKLARGFYLRAKIFVMKGEIGNAAKEIEKTLNIDAKSADFYALKGQILTRQGEYAEAEKALKKALELDKNSAEAYFRYGMYYYLKLNGDDAKAIEQFKKAYSLNSNFEQALLYTAHAYRDKEDWSNAEKSYKEVIKKFPTLTDAYVGYGYFFQDQNKLPEAKKQFDKALDLDNTSGNVLNALANYYYSAGVDDFNKAVSYYTKALALPNSFPWVIYDNRAWAYYYLEDYKNHLESLKQAADANPNKHDAYYLDEVAVAYYDNYDYANAKAVAEEALKIDAKMADSLTVLAAAYMNWDGHIDLNKALDYANKAVAADKNRFSLSTRAYAYIDKKEWDKAIDDLNASIAIKQKGRSPDYKLANNYAEICFCYYRKDDQAKALENCDKSLKVDSKYSDAYLYIGYVYERKGDMAKARSNYEKAIEVDADNEVAKEALKNL